MADDCLQNKPVERTPPKRAKLDPDIETSTDETVHEDDIDFSAFEIKRILQNNPMRKSVCVEGCFNGNENSSIVILEKQVFPADEFLLKGGFFNEEAVLKKKYTNDVYGNYECFPVKEHNGLNAMVIHPATPKHIQKYQKQNIHIVDETAELYQKITRPYIETNSFSLNWVENILNHKAEQNNILFEDRNEDNGFVLVSDLKWDGQVDTLKLIALPLKAIKSIRELNDSHLPLLKNIRDTGIKAIVSKYKINPSQLRIYFHYPPSYYYLHVHFAYLMFETPGIYVEKAHLLSTVINNIEMISEYYSKAVLSHSIPESSPLFAKYEELGILKKTRTDDA